MRFKITLFTYLTRLQRLTITTTSFFSNKSVERSTLLKDTCNCIWMFTVILTKQFRIYVNFFGISVAIINQQFLSRSNILFCYIVESSFALCDQHIFFSAITSAINEAKPRRYINVICINKMSYKSSMPSLEIKEWNWYQQFATLKIYYLQ